MKTFTWQSGFVSSGLVLVTDERMGRVVFLGEEGRGRRYEKVALDKRNPATVGEDGRALEAHVRKVTLPSKKKEGTEFSFWVLEAPSAHEDPEAVLVRINSLTSYIRNGRGYWTVESGKPETLVSGYGAFGDAGRIGNWDDGLVLMRPGDVFHVYPSRGDSFALWLEPDMVPKTASWKDYENIRAVEAAQAVVAEAEDESKALTIAYATMLAYTWNGGKLESGFRVSNGATGPVVAVGEEGRGRSRVELPLIKAVTAKKSGYGGQTEIVAEAAVLKLSEQVKPARYSWEKSERKVIYGLTHSDHREDAFLVRVSTGGGYTRRGSGNWEVWKGGPTLLVAGWGADGDAGRIGSWMDGLWVLREGDVLYARPSGGNAASAVFVEGGMLKTEGWSAWKAKDAQRDPPFYVAKGTAPWGHAPAEWIGQVVSVQDECRDTLHTGELVSTEPLVLNLGWDGRDYHPVTVSRGTWVVLEKDKRLRRLEGAEAEKRRQIRTEVEELRARAISATKQGFFGLAEASLREQVESLVREQAFDTMSTEGWYDSLSSWVENARTVLDTFDEASQELMSLEKRQSSGEVLVDFGGHFRRMGNSGNGDFWVVTAGGMLREPDEIEYRKRYTSEGNKRWRLIASTELALSWTGDPREPSYGTFDVAHAPVGGLTSTQAETVRLIEVDDLHGLPGMFGLDPELKTRYEAVEGAVRTALGKLRGKFWASDRELDLPYGGLREGGVCFASAGDVLRVQCSGAADSTCSNREAWTVYREQVVAGGERWTLVVLLYHWGGCWNLAVRLAEPSEEAPVVMEPQGTGKPASEDALAALAKKFGR